jgi:hypothetical protein
VIIKKKETLPKKNNYFSKFLKIYFTSTLILSILGILFFFNTGYWNQIKDPFLNRLYKSSVNHYSNIFFIGYSAIKGIFYEIPEINININFNNLIKIENDRKRVKKILGLDAGGSYDFLEVPVTINHNNKTYEAKLRLKGDRRVHFDEKKNSSYKINLKKDNTIFGVKKFSLMKPRIRNYVHEWLFHELNAEGGLVTLKYDFINLKINGAREGLYVLEEGFGKILLERNKKRNGPIFSLHEEYDANYTKDAKFEVYNKKYWLSEDNIDLTEIASQKLREYFNYEDNINLEDILDLNKWAWYFAVADINNYFHGLASKSVKFYYNPISGIFEPIGFDGHRSITNYSKFYDWNEQLSRHGPSSFEIAKTCKENPKLKKCDYFIYNFFFKKNGDLNIEFYNKYRNAILKISSKDFLDNFFKKRKRQIDKINSKIYGDYFYVDHLFFYGPGLYFFEKKDFYVKANLLLNSIKSESEKVFIQQDQENLIVQNSSINNNNLLITELHCNEHLSNKFKKINLNYGLKNKANKLIRINIGKYSKEKLICKKVLLKNKLNKNFFFKSIDTINNNREISYKQLLKNEYKKYFFDNDNILTLKKNITNIDENIYIPKNMQVKIRPGESIILTNNAFIFSDSAWKVDGDNDLINIVGKKNNLGGGLIISDSSNKSFFKNVNFAYLGGLKKNLGDINKQYSLLGSINFYESEISIEDCKFNNIYSEDALNIINSNFTLDNIFFSKNYSDGIDIDFGKGSIKNSKFMNIGNDAIDISGAKVKVLKVNINKVGDKMISVGENANVIINNLNGKNAHVGIASKDGSLTKINNVSIQNTQIAISAYQKKSEYLKAKIIASNLEIKDSNLKWLTDLNSEIFVENELVSSKTSQIIPIIYSKNISLIEQIKN